MKANAHPVLWAIAALLLLLPFSVARPGLPMALGSDEATYLAMAESLAHDRDLLCERRDLVRLFDEFPFTGPIRLDLASGDGWRSAAFDAPVAYSLVATPLVALFGSRGLLLLDMLAFVLCLWLGGRFLVRDERSGMALVFAAGYLLLSAAFLYAFRMRPEVLVMATLAAAYALAWRTSPAVELPPSRALGAGLCLGLAAAQDPLWALLAVPILAETLLARRGRAAALCLLGLLAIPALAAGLGRALDGPAAGDVSVSWPIEDPIALPFGPETTPPASPDPAAEAGPHGVGGRGPLHLAVGRHTGLLPYFPFLAVALWLFARGPRGGPRWRLLLVLAALTLGLGLGLPVEAGVPGNPRFVPLYPLFLLLVGRVRPLPTLAGYALGALFLGVALLTPFGSPVPHTQAPSHARNPPFPLLPMETRLLGVHPDYESLEAGEGARLWFPRGDARAVGDSVWVLGARAAELWLESPRQVDTAVFQVRNLAPENRIVLGLARARQVLDFEEVPPRGLGEQVRLAPGSPTARGAEGSHLYRLRVRTRRGEQPRWRESSERSYYLGAALTYLGSAEVLGRDLYAVRWGECGVPGVVAAGEDFLALARLENASEHPWPSRGAARVRLSYTWQRAGAGGDPARDGLRTDLAGDLPAGAPLTTWVRVRAPEEPGRYRLELDLLYEGVTWFSLRSGEPGCTAEVEVRPVAEDASETSSRGS